MIPPGEAGGSQGYNMDADKIADPLIFFLRILMLSSIL
jgi:hypothetical protein